MHACVEKGLIKEWRWDGTIVFTMRSLDPRFRDEAMALAKQMYTTVTGGFDRDGNT